MTNLGTHLSKLLPEEALNLPLINPPINKNVAPKDVIRKQLVRNLERHEEIGTLAAWIIGLAAMGATITLMIIFQLTTIANFILLGGIVAGAIFGATGWAIAAKYIYDPKIEALVESTVALDNALTYQRLPMLTAKKISEALDKPSDFPYTHDFSQTIFSNTTFAFAQNKEALTNVIEIFVKHSDAFLISKNEGSEKGFIIGTPCYTAGLHQALQSSETHFIFSNLPYRGIDCQKFHNHQDEKFLEGKKIDDSSKRLKLYSSMNFPQGVEFKVKNIYVGNTLHGGRIFASTTIGNCDPKAIAQSNKPYTGPRFGDSYYDADTVAAVL